MNLAIKNLAICMTGLMALNGASGPIQAVYRPSVVAENAPAAITATVVTADGQTVELKVVTPDEYTGLIDDIPEPVIQVTPLEEIQRFEDDPDGLSTFTNEVSLYLYTMIQDSSDEGVEHFLDKFEPSVKEEFEAALPEGKTIDDYEPYSMFDVTANTAAIELIGDGYVEVDVEMKELVTEDEDKLVVMNFHTDREDMTKKEIEDTTNPDEIYTDIYVVKHEIKEDGVLTLEMNKFSPVVVFKDKELDTNRTDKKEPTKAPTNVPTSTGSIFGWFQSIIDWFKSLFGGLFA